MGLDDYGWSEDWATAAAPHLRPGDEPGRILAQHKGRYLLATAAGEVDGLVSGRLLHDAAGVAELPAVGDWVAVTGQGSPLVIEAVLPRRSKLSRKAAGQRTVEQVIAANLDTLFLVMALDDNYRLARLERYLTAAWESGAAPVVLLTKADTCATVAERLAECRDAAAGAPVIALSALTGEGLDALAPHLPAGRTVGLVGSSGVGKSTLINHLLGEARLATQATREGDGKGRHTTTHRELHRLPTGALILDTPGMRELALWDAEESVAETFEDLEQLAEGCRFRDCRHVDEPDCRVLEAVADGRLSARRLATYHAMLRELGELRRKRERFAEVEDRRLRQRLQKTFSSKPKRWS